MAKNSHSLWHNLSWKYRNLTGYLRLFSSRADINTYRQMASGRAAKGEIAMLEMRPLHGERLLCRAQTTDPRVLWDAFYWRYQLPPVKMRDVRVIVDLGANVGYTAALWATLYPDAQIIAVEMDAENAELARKNTRFCHRRCRIVEAAIWTEEGTINYGGEVSCGFTIEKDGPKNARAITFDQLMKEENLESIDLLKMDIEGAEHDIFSVETPWLKSVRAIMLEFHPPAEEQMLVNRLQKEGFSCLPTKRKASIFALRK